MSGVASTSWSARDHVSTFVHSLHLLDLNTLEDWPDVTIQTFGLKSNLQHRLRCVEWSLYRLFELYDVKATRDKLRPFFPPSTSLQSVNLRAALIRLLTDLKKDGGLGGNVILRKTMLDECKGERFEELLANFSVIVLKKVLKKSGHEPTDAKPQHLLPLLLSYRKAIQRDLEKRKELDLKTRQQQRNIDSSIEALSEEAVAWKSRKVPAIPRNQDVLKRLARENWIGDNDWVDTILHGVPPTPGLLHDDMEDEDAEDEASVLLVDLESRVRAQNARLSQWQHYLSGLQRDDQLEMVQSPSEIPQHLSMPERFTKHQSISLARTSAEDPPPLIQLKSRHTALLEALDQDLSSRVKQSAVGTASPQVKRRPPVQEAVTPSSRRKPPAAMVHKVTPARRTSDASSQDTVVGVAQDNGRGHITGHTQSRPNHPSDLLQNNGSSVEIFDQFNALKTPRGAHENQSLAERTTASLAQFETPRAKLQRSRTSISPSRDEAAKTVVAMASNTQSDRTSLLDRTRQSMSFLTNILDDEIPARKPGRLNKARHSKSKSMFIPSERPRLERAWSEESLASAAKDDSFDVEADYESVFKSRPRLAMSPNLSPARNSDQLDEDLENALNNLTINSSSPDH